MSTLTIENVAEAIDQLVVERGENYVYPSDEGCFYSFEDGTPGCLVGAVLAKVAPEAFEMVVEYEAPVDDGNGGTHRISIGSVSGLDSWLELGTDKDLLNALDAAQQVQDTKGTWAEARRRFIDKVRA